MIEQMKRVIELHSRLAGHEPFGIICDASTIDGLTAALRDLRMTRTIVLVHPNAASWTTCGDEESFFGLLDQLARRGKGPQKPASLIDHDGRYLLARRIKTLRKHADHNRDYAAQIIAEAEREEKEAATLDGLLKRRAVEA